MEALGGGGASVAEKKFEMLFEDWLTFFGIWMAEGCTFYPTTSIAAHKPRVKEALNVIKERNPSLNLHRKKDKKDDTELNCYYIYDKILTKYMSTFSVGAVHKFLPDWAWCLTPAQARILISGMMLGESPEFLLMVIEPEAVTVPPVPSPSTDPGDTDCR